MSVIGAAAASFAVWVGTPMSISIVRSRLKWLYRVLDTAPVRAVLPAKTVRTWLLCDESSSSQVITTRQRSVVQAGLERIGGRLCGSHGRPRAPGRSGGAVDRVGG